MNQLGIFAKYWQPGQVKTRLGSSIGMTEAADVYRAMLENLTTRLAAVDANCVLSICPEERRTEFVSFEPAWNISLQAGEDLGAKMQHYFRTAFESGADRVLLIGSDCPLLTIADVNLAFDKLSDHDVVMGPSDDGGYYLIGGTSSMPDLFSEMRWSTSEVWPITVKRLSESSVAWAQLETRSDVDDIADLRRLRQALLESQYQTEEWDPLRTCVEHCKLDCE